MNAINSISRRSFTSSLATAMACLGAPLIANRSFGQAEAEAESTHNLSIYHSVKWGMIETKGAVVDKFQLCKELGYDGMELTSPTKIAATEVRSASDKTGLPVHGVVNMKHWEIRLSSPDPKTREAGQAILDQAIRDASHFGGDSVLLVPGKVNQSDENHDQVWNRSIKAIRKSIPLAARRGVRILIENVWNGFCADPNQLADYIDEIASPWVGCYFDIGNAQKFAPSEQWISTLGSRIVKLDVKDWGKKAGFCKIGDGDVNWQAVNVALKKTRFSGWSTAEVRGGDKDRLTEIAAKMKRVLPD